MPAISAIAIDDEPLGIQVVKEFCGRVEGIDLQATFTRATDALAYLEQHKTDLLFLDIEMPKISGIELFKKAPPGIMVIFTTAFAGHAVEGFNLRAIDYLLKPFSFDRFGKAIEKAKDHFQYLNTRTTGETEHIFIKVDHNMRKVTFNEIRYVEAMNNYLKIHLEDGKNILIRMALKTLLQQLPKGRFVRVHKSFIIPIARVTAFRNKTIYINDLQIPTSALYIDDVINIFNTQK